MVLQHRSSSGPSIGNLRCCPRPPVRPQSNDIILLFAAVILNLEAWFIGRYPYWSLHYWGEPYVPPDTLTIILTHVLATGFIVFSRFVEIEQSRTRRGPLNNLTWAWFCIPLCFSSQSLFLSFSIVAFLVLLPVAILRYVEVERHRSEHGPVAGWIWTLMWSIPLGVIPVFGLFRITIYPISIPIVAWLCFLMISWVMAIQRHQGIESNIVLRTYIRSFAHALLAAFLAVPALFILGMIVLFLPIW